MNAIRKFAIFLSAAWLTCAAFAVHAADVLITELKGEVTAKSSKKPVRVLDVVRAGDRLSLAAGAKASLFVAEGALLYNVEGPAEISFSKKGPAAVSGKLPVPVKLNDAYRKLRVDDPALAQASLVMRSSGGGPVLVSPEGVVGPATARQLRWSGDAKGELRVQLANDAGTVLFEAPAGTGPIDLPPDVRLATGVRHVWGIFPKAGGEPALDWTEFMVLADGEAAPPSPGAGASVSERIVHAAWLQQRKLPRAAARELLRVSVGQ